jgi:hypothetical protein
MFLKFILVSLSLSFTSIANADQFTVTDINSTGKKAEVKVDGSLKEGETLRHTDKFDENCDARVLKVTGSTAILDISSCENAKSFKVGAEFNRIDSSYVKPSPTAPAQESKPVANNGAPTDDEDWYTLWGFGFASVDYDDEDINDEMEDADDQPGVDRSTANYDLFGFYWPMADRKTMQGFIINVVLDGLDGPGGELTISQSLYAYSIQRFFGANIGDGWFVRGDVGLSRTTLDVDTYTIDDSESGDFGLGALTGGGYGLALTRQTRILFGAYLTSRKSGSERATTANVNMGFLF